VLCVNELDDVVWIFPDTHPAMGGPAVRETLTLFMFEKELLRLEVLPR
jgi:hypothetical protein